MVCLRDKDCLYWFLIGYAIGNGRIPTYWKDDIENALKEFEELKDSFEKRESVLDYFYESRGMKREVV